MSLWGQDLYRCACGEKFVICGYPGWIAGFEGFILFSPALIKVLMMELLHRNEVAWVFT